MTSEGGGGGGEAGEACKREEAEEGRCSAGGFIANLLGWALAALLSLSSAHLSPPIILFYPQQHLWMEEAVHCGWMSP
jgi:hypothetical protein